MTDAVDVMRQKLQQRVTESARRAGQLRESETCDPETGEILHGNRLRWLDPVKGPNGTGHQLAAGTEYVVRKTLTKDTPMYWAWHARKLLGYSTVVGSAQQHCEAHYARSLEVPG